VGGFATLEVSGDAAARGRAHGETFRERVQRACAFYLDELFAGVPLDRAALRARAETIAAIVRRLAPPQADEIAGIAAGAGLPPWQVHLLNARTEILNARVGECSALYFATSGVQGQTWDWVEPLEELCVVITHTRTDGHRYVAFGEPGMVGKIGLSAAGVGVCLNILFAPHDLSGLPVHVLIGAILNAASYDEARATIDVAGRGKASHLLVGSADGRAVSVEFFGDERHLLEPVDGVLLHTNHCLGRGAAGRTAALANSCARYDDLAREVAANPARDLARAREILSSTAGGDDALLREYRPSEVFPGQRVGSCATALMELGPRRLHLRRGPDAAAPFEVFTL
jgi:isopenicillin-N N-acyltransferase-like protein